MKKVFVSDYDGTLYQDGVVSDEVLSAIRAFRESGGLFGIATGRIINSIKYEIEKFDIPVDFLIGANGAVIMDGVSKKIYSFDINKEIAKEVFDFLASQEMNFYGLSDGFGIYGQGQDAALFDKFSMEYHDVMSRSIRGLYGRAQTREHAFELADIMNYRYGEHISVMPNYSGLDIVSVKTDKYDAIIKYIERFTEGCEVATAGDAHNDLKMLKHFRGYVMSHGDPEIVSQIERKVSTVDEALTDFINSVKGKG